MLQRVGLFGDSTKSSCEKLHSRFFSPFANSIRTHKLPIFIVRNCFVTFFVMFVCNFTIKSLDNIAGALTRGRGGIVFEKLLNCEWDCYLSRRRMINAVKYSVNVKILSNNWKGSLRHRPVQRSRTFKCSIKARRNLGYHFVLNKLYLQFSFKTRKFLEWALRDSHWAQTHYSKPFLMAFTFFPKREFIIKTTIKCHK